MAGRLTFPILLGWLGLTVLLTGTVQAHPPAPGTPDHPFLYRLGGQARLALPAGMQACLQQTFPDFVPWRETDYMPVIRQDYAFDWRQAPFAVVGDLNGDQQPDVALAGHTAQATLLLAILSMRSNPPAQDPWRYKVVVIDQGGLVDPARAGSQDGPAAEKGLGVYLRYVPPGTYVSGYEKSPLRLKHGAFEEIFYAKAAGIYAWNGQAFAWFVTAD